MLPDGPARRPIVSFAADDAISPSHSCSLAYQQPLDGLEWEISPLGEKAAWSFQPSNEMRRPCPNE